MSVANFNDQEFYLMVFQNAKDRLCSSYNLNDNQKAKVDTAKLHLVEKTDEKMGLIKKMGYCGYSHEDNTILIGFPYPYKNGADLPIERAILHELGHHMQNVIYEANIANCDRNILETHNIIFHENLIVTPVGNNHLYTTEGYRFAYNASGTFCQVPNFTWNNTKNALPQKITSLEGDSPEKKLLVAIQIRMNELESDINRVQGYYDAFKKLVSKALIG